MQYIFLIIQDKGRDLYYDIRSVVSDMDHGCTPWIGQRHRFVKD